MLQVHRCQPLPVHLLSTDGSRSPE
jgi:hypothetical protein